MKIAKFTYTDLKGKTTERTLLVTSEPSNKYSGIDVGELESSEVDEFKDAYELIYKTFTAEIEALKDAWDIKHNYRQFISDNMKDVRIEKL